MHIIPIGSDRIYLKTKLLGVKENTFTKFGAVSAEAATEMALCCQEKTGVTNAVLVTSIAGPNGASTENPVGTF